MKKTWIIVSVVTLCLFGFLLSPLKQVMAQSPDTYETTLEEMGYRDETLYGPQSSASFYFSLPASWEVLDGTSLSLDIDYQALLYDEGRYPPGMLTVRLNREVLYTEELLAPIGETINVDLPAAYFRSFDDPSLNTLQVIFEEYSPCELSTFAALTIKNTSTLNFNFGNRPLVADLALLPKPVYQSRSFEPGSVRFVLPDDFDEAEVRAATIIAARLGQLTYHNLPISMTIASDLPVDAAIEEHLVVIGTPERNPIIDQLPLSISLSERQLSLRSYMPGGVAPGAVLSYTLFVENTTTTPRSVIVEDRFSPLASFLNCGVRCELSEPGMVRWDVGSLGAGETVSTTVAVRAPSDILSEALLRHTATLLDAQDGDVLNVDTLATRVVENPDVRGVVSSQFKSPRIFVQDAEAVPEDAGVIQELVSPWSDRHVVLVVTALGDDGLVKAAHGLNPENHFPGFEGVSAVVEDLNPLESDESALLSDITFESLGYSNVELDLISFESVDYLLELPPGATLGDDSYLVLHISHTALISNIGGGVKISLNGMPVGSFILDDSNLNDAWVRIPLPKMAVRPGANRIRVESNVKTIDRCLITRNNPYWLAVYKDSFLHLDYKVTNSLFTLESFPYPFNWPGNMENILFALSDVPSLGEVEGLLRVASLLGSSSDSKDLLPEVVFGGAFDQTTLSDFNVIAIGLNTLNSTIRDANVYLPLPFLPESNDIYQSIDSPVYGILPGTNLGLIQELSSVWGGDAEHAFVVVTGTTEEGVRWALNALAYSVSQLQGDVAIVRETVVHSTDTQPVAFEEAFDLSEQVPPALTEEPEIVASDSITLSELEEAAETSQPDAVPEQVIASSSSRPWWLLILFFVSLLGIGVSVFFTLRKRNV